MKTAGKIVKQSGTWGLAWKGTTWYSDLKLAARKRKRDYNNVPPVVKSTASAVNNECAVYAKQGLTIKKLPSILLWRSAASVKWAYQAISIQE